MQHSRIHMINQRGKGEGIETCRNQLTTRLPGLLTSHVFLTIVFVSLMGTSTEGLIQWTLVTYPVIFGENAYIRCTIVEEKKPGHMAWKKCVGGHNTCATVGFNEISLNDTKYEVVMNSYNRSLTTYELIIKQFGTMDVNYKYRCESGFQYAVGEVSLNEIVALPKDHKIEKTFVMRDKNLTALIRIPNVYPRPICTATFKKRNITNMSNTTYVKQDVLYVAVCEVVYETYECKGDLNIFCHVGIRNISVMHSFNECDETTSANLSIIIKILPAIISSLMVLVVCLCFVRYHRRRRFRKRHQSQDQQLATKIKGPLYAKYKRAAIS